jgi:hypothetical protein
MPGLKKTSQADRERVKRDVAIDVPIAYDADTVIWWQG